MAHHHRTDNRPRAAATCHAAGGATRPGPGIAGQSAQGTRPRIAAGGTAVAPAIPPAGSCPARVAAAGAMWRLRSLIAMGHTTSRITAALAAPAHVVEPLIRGDRATITPGLRDDISRLFEAWWDKQPPRRSPAEKAAARKALQRAALHNWPCPAGLDDDELDQPGYTPAARWRYARGTGIAAADPLGNNLSTKAAPGPPRAGQPAEPERRASGPMNTQHTGPGTQAQRELAAG